MEELENPQGQTQDIRTYIQVRKKFWKNTKLSIWLAPIKRVFIDYC